MPDNLECTEDRGMLIAGEIMTQESHDRQIRESRDEPRDLKSLCSGSTEEQKASAPAPNNSKKGAHSAK